MRQLAIVQLLTWLGLFCMWLYFVPAVARHVFGATDPQSPLYTQGIEWGGFAFAFYSITCFVIALASIVIGASALALIFAVFLARWVLSRGRVSGGNRAFDDGRDRPGERR